MNNIKTKFLIKKYKDFFMYESSLVSLFGFECGDGWFDLLDSCLSEIKKKINNKYNFYITQIKEKFGTLRIYYSSSGSMEDEEDITKILLKYEIKSCKVCELCGKKAKLRRIHSWVYTLCEEHYEIEILNRVIS
jgi:hypothetical protein